MGKYDKVIGDLPSLPAESNPYEDKISALRTAIEKRDEQVLSEHDAEVLHLANTLFDTLERDMDALLDTGGEATPQALVRCYVRLRQEKAALDALEYQVNLRIAVLERMIAHSHETEELGWGQYGAKPNAVVLASGDNLRVDIEPVPKVVDKEAFRLWCIQNGYEHSLQLWPSTTAAISKELLVAGQKAPDGVEIFQRPKVVLTRAKE